MIKVVLILVLVVAFIVLGIKISDHYKRRTKFFDDCIKYLNINIIAVSYSHNKLIETIQENMDLFGNEFKEVLTLYKSFLKNEIERDNFNNLLYKKLYFLKPTEKCELVTFFCDLGIGDEESEICKITTFKNRLEYTYKNVDNERKTYSPLYLKLSVVLAVLFFILFI